MMKRVDPEQLSLDQIDAIVDQHPEQAIFYIHDHLNKYHIDALVKKYPSSVAKHIPNHPKLNQTHIDYIVKETPRYAVVWLKHRLSEANLEYLALNHPAIYEELFK